MSSIPSLYESANSSTSTLRPRNPRLISYVDDENDEQATPKQKIPTSTATASSFLAPGVSTGGAISRAQSVSKKDSGQNKHKSHNRSSSASAQAGSSGGLWDSWSSIQDIASTFLKNDAAGNVSRRRSKGKKPVWMKQDKVYSTSQSQKEWGPKNESTLSGNDPIQERQALVQAKKREALLLSSTQAQKDPLGRYKRKDSDTNFQSSVAAETEGDVLVYRHKVSTRDTLAGVTIKYSCQPEVFRKVNRFWPNDNIQRRTHVLLPVEACTIRGKRVENAQTGHTPSAERKVSTDESRKFSLDNGSFSPFPETEVVIPSPSTPPPPSSSSSTNLDADYKHDSWVSLPSFVEPVEILRISRHTLGYFPPARRKSNSQVFLDSPVSTPKTSFDMLRHPPTHAAQQAVLQHQSSLSFDASPSRRPNLPPHLNSSQRTRSSSTASAPSSSANNLANVFRGPGGVGNLRGLRTEVARPGPSEDSLNKKFASYIPDLMPPDEDLLSVNFARALSMTPSHRTTPRASTDSIRSSRSNSSTMPAAIEGWMRKITGSGTSTAATSPLRRRAEGHREAVPGSMGDLIELEVNTDSYFGSQSGADEELTPRPMPSQRIADGFTPVGSKKTDEELLDDRFPIRGRIRRAYEGE